MTSSDTYTDSSKQDSKTCQYTIVVTFPRILHHAIRYSMHAFTKK